MGTVSGTRPAPLPDTYSKPVTAPVASRAMVAYGLESSSASWSWKSVHRSSNLIDWWAREAKERARKKRTKRAEEGGVSS